MKELMYFRLLFISISVLFFFSSCSKEDPEVEPELTVSVANLAFSTGSETKSFHVQANTKWGGSSSEPWCTITPTTGDAGTIKIDVTVAENTTFNVRTAQITVVAGTITRQITVTQAESTSLVVQQSEFNVSADGEEITVDIQASTAFEISISHNWITKTGNTSQSETFSISANPYVMSREGIITFTLGNLMEEVIVRQQGMNLFIPSDMDGMASNAATLASKMIIGWNLGNSLEATNAGGTSASETSWGNPKTTKAMIDAVKAAGFNAVRIPCAWSGYIEDQSNYKIRDSWLARVKEVVDYVVENDMYAIINVHWDGGWLENNPFYNKQVQNNKKQKAFWEQIAVYFRDYDERLLFAGTNEVHADYGNPTTEHVTVQMSYNQTFVDAVRSTGGKNTYRNLVIQAYNTNINHAQNHLVMSTDPTPDRMMAEVHFYDPWDFAGETGTVFKTQWGSPFVGGDVSSWGQETWVNEAFGKMKTKFVDHGIPVILGEYGALLRSSLTGEQLTKHIQARNYYLEYVTNAAIEKGLIPFYWDNGFTGNNGFALFNRNTTAVFRQDAIDALMKGAGVK